MTLLHVGDTQDKNGKKKKKVSKAKATERIFKTFKKVKELPEEYTKDDFAALICALEQVLPLPLPFLLLLTPCYPRTIKGEGFIFPSYVPRR